MTAPGIRHTKNTAGENWGDATPNASAVPMRLATTSIPAIGRGDGQIVEYTIATATITNR